MATKARAQVLQPTLKKLSYQADSFDYLCGTYDVPLMLMVTQDSPFKSLADVTAFAKQNPGKLNYGSSGQGTALHITMAALLKKAGADGLHVPYKSSGEMATGLLGKHIMMFAETPAVATQYQLRPLAVFSDKRLDTHPSVPTAGEGGFEVRGSVWGGLVGPKGLPAETRSKLAAACVKATASDAYKAGATRLNSPLVYRDGATFAAFAESVPSPSSFPSTYSLRRLFDIFHVAATWCHTPSSIFDLAATAPTQPISKQSRPSRTKNVWPSGIHFGPGSVSARIVPSDSVRMRATIEKS